MKNGYEMLRLVEIQAPA